MPTMEQDKEYKMLMQKIETHQQNGLDMSHATELANLERLIGIWPSAWGEYFRVHIYGDFRAPENDLQFDELKITIHNKQIDGTGVHALTVLEADVSVEEKTVTAVKDAARRLNLLVGVLCLSHTGMPIRWYSPLFSYGSTWSAFASLDALAANKAVEQINKLPEKVKRKVTAALFWIRQPRNMSHEHVRDDHFQSYAGYWSAFECLVKAVNILSPQDSRTSTQKNDGLTNRLSALPAPLSVGDIDTLYKEFVNPGLRQKAEHAIKICMGGRAEHFITQCFASEPAEQQLYKIRNDINHGNVDIDDPEIRMIVESRLMVLWELVFNLLHGVLALNERIVQKSQ